MSDCHRSPEADRPSAIPAADSCCAPAQSSGCHEGTPAEDSCCETPAQRDYLFWGSLAIVAIAYPVGALMQHQHDSVIGMFTGGIFELFNRMWWGILIGIVFVGILGRIPRDLVMGMLGRGTGLSSLGRATLAGVFLDLCSHGILAVGMKLYERGASIGQVMAFLLASPWNSFSLTLILFGLIGVGWTLLFILLSLVIG
ncbi:MAG: permease, partial [Halioglobus sp.]